jgi:hypothetical protein
MATGYGLGKQPQVSEQSSKLGSAREGQTTIPLHLKDLLSKEVPKVARRGVYNPVKNSVKVWEMNLTDFTFSGLLPLLYSRALLMGQ